ncbi:MAG: tRNA (adenosine(37)-N6)-dimethylallyltransferase MiaA [Thermoleophilia bacterium]
MPFSHNTVVVAIFGPTAVGKSSVGASVAAAAGGEIISADSMQVYRGLPILTDQPPAQLLARVPHHLVDSLPPGEEYSAARFAREAGAMIAAAAGRGRLPIVVGGTGLYIRALLGDFSFAGRGEAGSRRRWEALIAREGAAAALARLQQLDPGAAAGIDAGNPRRLARALEAAESGRPLSAQRDRLWSPRSKYRVLSFGLELPREELYRRIDERVERMLAAGALDEVRTALAGPVSRTAAQAIGFRELAACLEGKLTLDEAAAAIRQKSRRYAKRQLTWMRKMPDIVRIDLAGETANRAVDVILERLRAAGLAAGPDPAP